MDPRNENLEITAELEAIRPRPRPAFAAELDARVAARFQPAEGGAGSWRDRLEQALGNLTWRRLAVPAGAAALVAIAAATAVISISESGSGNGRELRSGGSEMLSDQATTTRPQRLHEFSTSLPQKAQATAGNASAESAVGTASAP